MDEAKLVVLAWSGGKDSTLTLAALQADDRYRVVGLVTTVTPQFDRVSVHGIRRSILHAQAESLGLPLVEAQLDSPSSINDYERAWAEALSSAKKQFGPFDHVAYGDLFLEDIRQYRDAQLSKIGLQAVYPIWGKPTRQLAKHFVDSGYRAYLTCVDTTQMPGDFAGECYDRELLAKLPETVDPCGEHGEFHTCVVDGPIFVKRIPVEIGRREFRDQRFEFCDLVLSENNQVATL